MTEELENKNLERKKEIRLTSFALELGFSIALPLVGLAFFGRFLDRWWGTSPWLLLIGIFISMIVSIVIIYRKTRDLLG